MESAISTADELIAKHDVKTAYELMEKVTAAEGGLLTGSPADVELLWRHARAAYLMGKEVQGDARKALYEQASNQIQKALAISANGAVQKWGGIILGGLGEFKATKEKIADAYKIKEHFEKALELIPNDATVHHCLGTWCFQILQIGMIERAAAKVIFGTPPTSTYEECEKHLVRSAELDPASVLNNKLLGDCFYQQKKYADAKKAYQSAIDLPAETNFMKETQAEARKMLGKC
jgi:tetratricopeptide (TPR) repeat protein